MKYDSWQDIGYKYVNIYRNIMIFSVNIDQYMAHLPHCGEYSIYCGLKVVNNYWQVRRMCRFVQSRQMTLCELLAVLVKRLRIFSQVATARTSDVYLPSSLGSNWGEARQNTCTGLRGAVFCYSNLSFVKIKRKKRFTHIWCPHFSELVICYVWYEI